MPESNRNTVFISYSHVDASWLGRLQVHLKPIERKGLIERWDDTKISVGDLWRGEIKDAIDRARVAILLVSADFLASDFIANDELPPLIKSAKEDGLIVLPIIISPSAFTRTENLKDYQAANDPKRPIESLAKHEQDQIFDSIVLKVEEILSRNNVQSAVGTEKIMEDAIDIPKKQLKVSPEEKRKTEDLILLNVDNQFEILVPIASAIGNSSVIITTVIRSAEDSQLLKKLPL